MITIYQIRLSDSDCVSINARGWSATIKTDAYASMRMGGADKWKPQYTSYYEAVYEVDTNDLDHAFEATNLWESDTVKRLQRGSSSSVGDIFVKDGDCYIVDNFGFTNVGKYELGVN